jgi:hypothetical protein
MTNIPPKTIAVWTRRWSVVIDDEAKDNDIKHRFSPLPSIPTQLVTCVLMVIPTNPHCYVIARAVAQM